MDSKIDLVQFFIANGVPEIIHTILSMLNYFDLKAACLVSKLWQKNVCQERIWKSQFYKLTADPVMWRLFVDMYGGPAHHIGNYFLACEDIVKEHEKLFMNWLHGKYREKKARSLLAAEKVTCMDMNRDYIVVGQADGKVVLHRRFDYLTSDLISTSAKKTCFLSADDSSITEKEFMLTGSLRQVTSLQIDERNILVCAGNRGVIEVWNVSSRTIVSSLRQKNVSRIECLRFFAHKLYTAGSLENAKSSCVTLWNMETPANICHVEEELFDSQSVVQISLDCRLLILLLKKGFSYEIAVRKFEKHTVTNAFSITYETQYFCGFHYEAGYIAAASDDGKIRIWDAGSGECKRILLRPTCDTGPIAIRFNSTILATNSRDGITIWNFKGALDKSLPWQTKLRCCFVQASCYTLRDQLFFLMDGVEIVKFGYSDNRPGRTGLLAQLEFQS